MAKKEKPKLTTRQYFTAIAGVAKITYTAAPLAVIIQIIGAIISAVLPIVTTYFAALTTTELANAYAGDPNAGRQALTYVIITALLGVIMMGWRSLESYVGQVMRYKIEAAISDQMYHHFLSLDFWRYDDKDTADLYDKATDFGRFFPYVFDRVTTMFSALINMLAGIVALAFVSWWLSLIVIVAIIPGVYVQFRLSRAQINHRNANVETRRSKNLLEWILGNQGVTAELRLYNVVRYMLDLRQKLRDKDEKERINFERKYIFKKFAADVLESIAEVITLVFIVLQIIARQQPIGQFIYVQQVVSRAFGGANGFVFNMSALDEDLANLFDYQEFMKLPERKGGTHRLADMPESIKLENISFYYPNSKTKVLDDVSLTIKKGQHVAIVGENGAGKSTLIKILTGLYRPVSGIVSIDSQDLETVDIKSWHRLLGVLQQDFITYTFATAKENIIFGDVSTPVDEERFEAAMDRAEARKFLEKLPKGVDSYVETWLEHADGTKGVSLSGGQWQRLALARNFYRDSPMIILDEPTSAIDALAEARIFKNLFADKKRTVVTISHRLTTTEKADVIYVLQDGKLAESGTHKELVKKRGAYYTMFEGQLRI